MGEARVMNFRFSIFDFRFPFQSKTCPERSRGIQNLKSKLVDYGRLVRFSHTIFALPFALAVIFFYSLTKRFTWTYHLFLGLALSLAPMGAWLAVSGLPIDLDELKTPLFLGLAVLFWLAGFDVIYSLQDFDFDRQQGLHSIPVHFGIAGALRLSGLFHFGTVLFLAMVGLSAQLGIVYWIGFIAVSAVLYWEHRIVRPDDLSRINRAF